MNCAACGHANSERAKFCLECGTRFALRCASCGVELPAAAKFCPECGTRTETPAASPSPTSVARDTDTRKVVTIVFADLVGSTALHERLEPESARRFMEAYYVAMRGAVEAHGGTVTQLLGDGVKAVFGIPRVAEDDAIRAVRAAVAMQDAFRRLAEAQRGAVGQTGLRVAVNTGEVVANDATEIIGDPVNVAARLQEQGKDGDVVVGESTHRLVSTLVTLELLGSFALKGRSEAVKAYRVVSLERPAGAATAPFVGRDEELARLTAVYVTAVEKPASGLAVLVGSPGLGKSRLIDEFARRLADAAAVVLANCDAAGGATFSPLAEALRERLEIESSANADALRAAVEAALPAEEADRARIASGIAALLAGAPPSPEETFFVVRRLLGALAHAKPVVLVIDDLQWAEPLLLDLVEHLIQWGSGTALFVLIGARPELRDLRSSLVTPGGLVSDVITLAGLDAGAAMRLAANAIGASDLPAAIAAKVLATSEGNPLFVGELVRMLVQEGAITRDGDRWIAGANLAALEMPPTIHALLAARIERLRPEERTVLERAAVVGRHFSRSAVAALLPQSGDLDARLEALRRSELIERDTGWLLGEPVLRFHHVLIRDAAYRRLLKGTRAELHAKLADWIEAKVGDAPEHDETIGWHLEQAHAFLRELGPLDENGKQLGARAATRLAAAGRRALTGDDVPLAASLLGRAIERLDADDPARADLALDWCEALLSAGDVGPAADAIAELARFAASDDRVRAWHTCFASQLTVLTAPQELQAAADAVAEAAEQLTAQGDAAGEAKAHSVHAQALARLGKVGACEAALDQALAAARRAGDRRRANAVLAGAPLAALWGPSPVTRASGRCLDVVRVLRITQGAPAVESVALSCQGVLEALRGRTDAARRMLASARRMVEELGIASRLFEADVFAGRIEAMEGDTVAAERLLRGAYEGLRDLGLGIDAARSGALLARVLLAQDRGAEAEALTHQSEALAGDDLQAAIAWRGVRAEALAKRGEHAAAIELAQAAVAIASATDALLDHADARMALAAALRAAGRLAEADAEERRARELWEAKGATLLAERAAPADVPVAPPLPAAAPPAAHTARRRPVRPNFAFEEMRRAEAAVAARDARALETLYRRDIEIVDHQFGITYGYAEIVERVRAIIEDSTESAFAHEPLASLGESLALCRMRSTASGSTIHGVSIGATEIPYLLLLEADEQGSARRIEIFGDDKLGGAVVRLHERYAELVPDGPEQARAAMAARSMAAVAGGYDDPEQRLAPVLAGDFVGVDHRHLSNWSLRGAAAYIEHLRALRQVADDIEFRQIDVVALGPYAQLSRVLHTGTARAGGGIYERPFLSLFVTDAEGRLARGEWFDADREAEALARFDALTAAPSKSRRVTPRVRPNRASAAIARFDAACVAHDVAAAAAQHRVDFEETNHPTGSRYGLDAACDGLQRLLRAHDPYMKHEPQATLGEGLLLARRATGASATRGGRFDVGAWARDEWTVTEADTSGRIVATEIFAHDRLGDALVRLYERYAAQQPEGPARTRATAAALAVSTSCGPIDLDRRSLAHAADLRLVDHRVFATSSSNSAAELLDHFRRQLELAPDLAARIDGVLGVQPDGLLLRTAYAGTFVDSGGAFENLLCEIFRFGDDGRVAEIHCFEAEQETEALARWAELDATAPAPGAFENAASATAEPLIAAVVANDWARYAARFSETLRGLDRRRLVQLDFDRDAHVAFARALAEGRRARGESELLATRGERLALIRFTFVFEDADVGPSEIVFLLVTEVDASGQIVAYVRFDDDDLDAAHDALDARYDAAEATLHPRATAARMAQRRPYSDRDWDAFAATHAPDLVCHDHRLLGWGTLRGADAFLRTQRALVELAPDTRVRNKHVATAEHGYLVSAVISGTRDGGAFELAFLRVSEIDATGRLCRIDLYDTGDDAAARARFAELVARDETGLGPFENAASRAWRRVIDAWRARDPARFEALHPRALRYRDRRRLFQLDLDRQGFLDFTRPLLAMRTGSAAIGLVATRGERLALMRFTLTMEDETVGPSAIDSLLLIETDEHGAITAYDRWDLEDREAAYAELDARWPVSETNEHATTRAWFRSFGLAMSSRDWNAAVACFAPALVAHDQRLVGWGTRNGPADFLQTMQAMIELAPDVRLRMEHLRTSQRALVAEAVWVGTRDGGAFESALVVVVELDERGRAARIDFYDPRHLDRALARFEEARASERRDPLVAVPRSNAASAAMDRWQASYDVAFETGDFEPIRALCAPGVVWDDRRRLALISGDRDLFVASARERVAMGAHPLLTTLGTAGDRVVLQTVLWSGGPADGRFEIEYIAVSECDPSGLLTAIVLFDPDDPRAAQREAWARWAAIDPGVAPWVELLNAMTDGWNARDRAALRARFADDVVVVDHRHTGIGRIEGAAAYVDANAVLWDLAPDQRVEFDSSGLRFDRHALLVTLRRVGTLPDGGAFESAYVWVSRVVGGRIERLELFEIEDLERAHARFEALRAGGRREGSAGSVKPNLATAAMARNWAAFDALELDAAQEALDAARAYYAPDFVWEDRRPLVGLSGGLDLMVASARERLASGARHERRSIVGTAGDRVAIARVLWAGGPADGRFEVEFLVVAEVNEAGLFTAHVFFEPGETRAAQREAWARWAAIDPGVAPWVELLNAMTDGWNARDRAALRARFADDVVVVDHRHTGIGRIEGAAAYVDANAVLWELAPDQRIEFDSASLVFCRRALLATLHRAGTLADGGAFESEYVWLSLVSGGRITRLELFEVEAHGEALARFEALRRDPLPLPPTTATRIRDRHRDAFIARDWDTMRALTGAGFVYEDRGKLALVRGDIESWIASMQFTTQPGFRADTALIGTLGDRIVLDQVRWFGKPGGDAFEFERVRLLEVGADGLLRAVLFFDPEDRSAATVEGLARFAAGEAAGSAGIAPVLAIFRALCDRDWEAVRACFAPDLVLVDHRALSFGTLDREQWIAALQAQENLADGISWDVFHVAAWSDHGLVAGIRRRGNIANGGGLFENELYATAFVVGGRIARYEIFEPEHVDRALARFAELGGSTPIA